MSNFEYNFAPAPPCKKINSIPKIIQPTFHFIYTASAGKEKEKKKHVHSEAETQEGAKIINAFLGSGRILPDRYVPHQKNTNYFHLFFKL